MGPGVEGWRHGRPVNWAFTQGMLLSGERLFGAQETSR